MSQPPTRIDLSRAPALTKEVEAEIEQLFAYHPWDAKQMDQGARVRDALAAAVKVIIEHVPPCPNRTVAIRNITEARMNANLAITFRGRY